jgi:hypothetical protein
MRNAYVLGAARAKDPQERCVMFDAARAHYHTWEFPSGSHYAVNVHPDVLAVVEWARDGGVAYDADRAAGEVLALVKAGGHDPQGKLVIYCDHDGIWSELAVRSGRPPGLHTLHGVEGHAAKALNAARSYVYYGPGVLEPTEGGRFAELAREVMAGAPPSAHDRGHGPER